MNYSDSILENKLFNLFKQGVYYICLSIIIILAGCLILIYGFSFRPYNVITDSMAPVYTAGDLVVIHPDDSYEVEDILKFDRNGLPTLHRCIAIYEYQGERYYLCKGDATNDLDGTGRGMDWEDDVAWINNKENIDLDSMSPSEIEDQFGGNVQVTTLDSIEGKSVTSFKNWGTYATFIQEHRVLVIAIVIAIWCIIETLQNEIDIKRSLRLL